MNHQGSAPVPPLNPCRIGDQSQWAPPLYLSRQGDGGRGGEMRRPLANSLANGPITEQIFSLSLCYQPGVKRWEPLSRTDEGWREEPISSKGQRSRCGVDERTPIIGCFTKSLQRQWDSSPPTYFWWIYLSVITAFSQVVVRSLEFLKYIHYKVFFLLIFMTFYNVDCRSGQTMNYHMKNVLNTLKYPKTNIPK